MKRIITIAMAALLAVSIAGHADAKGFSGGGRSSSFSSVSRSSYSSVSRPSITSSSKSVSGTFRSFTGGSSTKSTSSKSSTSTSKSFSGKTSTTASTSKSFSGKTSTVTGKTYTSKATRTTVYGGRSVYVSHYYHVGYSPYSWFGYYHGFTTGMFMSSMMHPWGYAYPVSGQYVSYGASPIAWVIDIFMLLFLLALVLFIIHEYKSHKRRKKIKKHYYIKGKTL